GFKVALQAGQIQSLHPAVFPVLVLLNPATPAVPGTESSPSNAAVANGVESSTEEADMVASGSGEADAIEASTDVEGGAGESPPEYGSALVIKTDGERVLYITVDSPAPKTTSLSEFNTRFAGQIILATPKHKPLAEDIKAPARFGFKW